MSRLLVNDSTCCVKPLMVLSASLSCWSREVMAGSEDGREEGVEMSEKVGEVCQ